MVIGYDDLTNVIGTNPENLSILQKGHSWMLTCSRLLNDEASGNGVVIVPEVPAGNYEDEIETDFNMDILCCDPDETEVGFTRLNSKQLQYLVNFMYIRAL